MSDLVGNPEDRFSHEMAHLYFSRLLVNGTLRDNQLVNGSEVTLLPNMETGTAVNIFLSSSCNDCLRPAQIQFYIILGNTIIFLYVSSDTPFLDCPKDHFLDNVPVILYAGPPPQWGYWGL